MTRITIILELRVYGENELQNNSKFIYFYIYLYKPRDICIHTYTP